MCFRLQYAWILNKIGNIKAGYLWNMWIRLEDEDFQVFELLKYTDIAENVKDLVDLLNALIPEQVYERGIMRFKYDEVGNIVTFTNTGGTMVLGKRIRMNYVFLFLNFLGKNIAGALGLVKESDFYPDSQTVLFIQGVHTSGTWKPMISILGGSILHLKLGIVKPSVFGGKYSPIIATFNTQVLKKQKDTLETECYLEYTSNGVNNSFHDIIESHVRSIQISLVDENDSAVIFCPSVDSVPLFTLGFEFKKLNWMYR